MPTINTSTLTTINKDTPGSWTSRTCSGFLQPLQEDITAGQSCTFPSGGIYQDNNGTGDCFECIGYSRTEVRTLKSNTTTVYVKVYVSFDENGGSAVSDKYVYYGSNRTYGTLPTPSRSGYTFQGWWTSESNNNGTGTQIISSTVVSTTALTQTLYAKWGQQTVAPSVTQLQCVNNQLYANVYWGGFNYPSASVEVSQFPNFASKITVTISSNSTVNVGSLGSIGSGTYTVYARATDAGGVTSTTASRTQNVGCFGFG
jgi:uncharacterized repeat protein (TIGR02543 family)